MYEDIVKALSRTNTSDTVVMADFNGAWRIQIRTVGLRM